MRLIRVLAVVVVALMALSSCSRDPNVAKKRYLDSGNKYFDKGNYKAAVLMYRDALQKDKKFGEAHYRLGLTYLKMNNLAEGVRSLRRSTEFLNHNDAHYWDAIVRLSQIYISVASRDKNLMAEAKGYSDALLAKDPNSFDGHHIAGELINLDGLQAYRVGNKEETRKDLDAALAEYKKADAAKPNQPLVLMEIAGVYEMQDNFAEAEEIFRNVIQSDPHYIAAYVNLYSLAIGQKKMDLAEQMLRDGFKNNPTQFAFLQRLALFYWVQHRPEDMNKTLQEIKSHAKEYAGAYRDVGDFYYRQGDGESAIREYREGMSKDPKQRALYQKLIIEVLMHQGKRNEAANINQQILAENPNDTDAKSLDATLKLDKGDIAHALTELQQVVTRAPDNPVAHFNLGRAHAMRGDYEQARQQFDRAIEIRTDYMAARIALAQLQATRGDYEAAIKATQMVLQIDPNNLSARLIETAAMIGLKRYSDAHAMLDAVLVSNPNQPDVLFQIAVVDMAENKYKEAETNFRKVYDLNPANPRGLLGLTETYLTQGKVDQAISTLKTESDKAPARLDLQVAIADVASRSGRYAMALEYYQRVADSLEKGAKQRADIFVRMGETYRRKGDLQNSIASMRKAAEIQPESVPVLSTLALALDQAGQWSEASKVYEAALKFDPNNAISLNNLAYLEAEHGGDLNRAQTLAQRAKQFMPNRPEVADTLGWIYLKRNLAENAADIFSELVRTNPHSSTFHYHLAQALDQKGDKAGALHELNIAVKENPQADEEKSIKEMIQRLTR
jgi:tetratricopeptide (TPR) repeat protein